MGTNEFARRYESEGADAFAQFEAETGSRFEFGTFPPGSVPDITLRYWLVEELGLEPGSDVTVTALGLVPRGRALLRSGARPGDLVVVSGIPGLAASALAARDRGSPPEADAERRLLRPEPRLALGRALRGRATACIDVSDGLAADLGHLLDASGHGASLWLERLPTAPAFETVSVRERWNLQSGGGDDYELCFTWPARDAPALDDLATQGGVALTLIGRVTEQRGLRLLDPAGEPFEPERSGWNHFALPDNGAP